MANLFNQFSSKSSFLKSVLYGSCHFSQITCCSSLLKSVLVQKINFKVQISFGAYYITYACIVQSLHRSSSCINDVTPLEHITQHISTLHIMHKAYNAQPKPGFSNHPRKFRVILGRTKFQSYSQEQISLFSSVQMESCSEVIQQWC